MTVASISPFIVVCLIKATAVSVKNADKKNWKS